MSENKKRNKNGVLSLDQVDAVCDELLKAFEQADPSGLGVLDRSGFQRFMDILSGKNVRSVVFHRSIFEKNNTTISVSARANVFCPTWEFGALAHTLPEKGDASAPTLLGELTAAGNALLQRKKRELLVLTFEDIDRDGEGEISTDQVLEAVGLGLAIECLVEHANADASTSLKALLWPSASCLEQRDTHRGSSGMAQGRKTTCPMSVCVV